MHDALMKLKTFTIRKKEPASTRNLIRSLLIVGYIVAVLLISGLARASSKTEMRFEVFEDLNGSLTLTDRNESVVPSNWLASLSSF